MNERELFTPRETIRGDQPLDETEFWAWLKDRAHRGEWIFYNDILAFLGEQGFKMNLHFLSNEQLHAHQSAHELFWWRKVRNLG